mmetsp:Transcript_147982/g.368794  ORF Transcript_147982/g.368794 Transcript_147982/m.368794 type:complete len:884 (+) Transcript_147982:131-2782(+)
MLRGWRSKPWLLLAAILAIQGECPESAASTGIAQRDVLAQRHNSLAAKGVHRGGRRGAAARLRHHARYSRSKRAQVPAHRHELDHPKSVRGHKHGSGTALIQQQRRIEMKSEMSVGEALAQLPVHVNEMFTQVQQGGGSTSDFMDALNEVYRRALDASDAWTLKCRDQGEQLQREVGNARTLLHNAERSVTQLQDRMQNLQSGVDRSLAELETLRDQYKRHQMSCQQNQQRDEAALRQLSADLPLARSLVSNLTQTCGFSGGTAPAFFECSLPDGSYVVTFADETLRSQVGQLSGLVERLLALQLERSVRSHIANTPSLLQMRVREHRLRGHHPSTPHGLHQQALPHRSQGKNVSNSHHRLQHLSLIQRRQLLTKRTLPTDMCTSTASPPCENFADNLATFSGGVEDLADELKMRMQAEADSCRTSLGQYEMRIQDLKRQSDDGGVALANAVAEQSDLESSRRVRREQVEDLSSEAKQSSDQCSQELEAARTSMCSAKALVRDLGDVVSTGAFLGDCVITDWVGGPCSQPCGTGGVQNVTRRVIHAPATDRLCPALEATRKCNEKPCPVDGLMSRWDEWSECSQACGGGTRTRHRSVIRHAEHGGVPTGETMQEQLCNMHPCDQDCALSDWTSWSMCSKNCSGGHRIRFRHVLRQPVGNGGCPADNDPERRQAAPCNADACQTSPAPQCASPLDVIMAVDTSGSMGSAGLTDAKQFAEAVATRTQFGDADVATGAPALARMGVVQFGASAAVAQALTADKTEFSAGLAAITWQPSETNMGEALAVASDMLDHHGRARSQPVVVVITDGMPMSAYVLSTEADKLRQSGVRLTFVLVGPGVSHHAVERWASWPAQENVVVVHSFAALREQAIVTSLLANLCPSLE